MLSDRGEYNGERQIDSTLHKLRETVKTFEAKEDKNRYKSQITLAKNRIKAFKIANILVEQEITMKIHNKDTDLTCFYRD